MSNNDENSTLPTLLELAAAKIANTALQCPLGRVECLNYLDKYCIPSINVQYKVVESCDLVEFLRKDYSSACCVVKTKVDYTQKIMDHLNKDL